MISNNGKKVQTAYELERKYNLRGIKKKVSESSEELTETKNSLTNIMTALLINLADVLDSQSEISLWFYSGIPTTSNEPYTSWTTPEDHIGDLYYNTATGYVYKYTSNGWTEQDDKDLRRAMALSNVLLGTTDHERKVNFTTPTIPYYCGDWWIKEDGTLYICQTERTIGDYDSTDWINSAEYQSAVSMAMTDELGNSVLEVLSGTRIETTDKWVKFKNLANSGETIINGDNITTGEIESNNYIEGTSGSKLSLYDGSFDSKYLSWDAYGHLYATNGSFSGSITATSGTFTGDSISIGSTNKTIIDIYGQKFYYDGTFVGHIGATQNSSDHSQKALHFGMDDGRFMGWGVSNGTNYIEKLYYCKANSFGETNEGIYLGTNFYGNWYDMSGINITSLRSNNYATASNRVPIITEIHRNSDNSIGWTSSSITVRNGIVTGVPEGSSSL